VGMGARVGHRHAWVAGPLRVVRNQRRGREGRGGGGREEKRLLGKKYDFQRSRQPIPSGNFQQHTGDAQHRAPAH